MAPSQPFLIGDRDALVDNSNKTEAGRWQLEVFQRKRRNFEDKKGYHEI
jgi:hypothetical protein